MVMCFLMSVASTGDRRDMEQPYRGITSVSILAGTAFLGQGSLTGARGIGTAHTIALPNAFLYTERRL
jgi:hypothetical protein